MPEYINNIQKTYKDYIKIIQYDRSWQPTKKSGKLKIKTQEILTKESLEAKKWEQNIQRARTAIHDIVACNNFEYFVTLTISPTSKLDRYNYDDCAKHLSTWLKYHLTRYILVPEKHKDGAYHFHLLADIPKTSLTHHKGKIYNIKKYKFGYSTAIKIEKNSSPRIANYIRKYITKDLVSTVGKNRRRYWCSKNLDRPTVEYNVTLPPNLAPVYTHDFIRIFHLPVTGK